MFLPGISYPVIEVAEDVCPEVITDNRDE